MSESWWRGIILTLSAAVISLTVWCLMHGITIIFMHLYYFPIVLLAYRYRWKGAGLAALLSAVYLLMVVLSSPGQPDTISGAFIRFLIFIGIALVIAWLSDRLHAVQENLRLSKEVSERYLSLAPAIVLALDEKGRITLLNEKGCEILECEGKDPTGQVWAETFIPEEDRDEIRTIITTLNSGDSTRFPVHENEVITQRGNVRTIRWYNTLFGDDGGSRGILSFGEDITEEKRAQEDLRKLQQFQENIIANASIWISVLSQDGRILVWNDAAERISGYKKADVVGKKTIWKQLYPSSEYRRSLTTDIQRIIRRDSILDDFETVIRCADGTTKTLVWNTRGLRDSSATLTGYITIGRDVTAQKAAEFRAGESSRFLAAMINTLPIPVFFKDTAGRYLGCNPPFEEYIGIKQDQLVGKTVHDISPRDLADQYTAADQQMFDNPAPQRYETQVQFADGSRHDVIFFKAPFFDRDGSVAGLIGAFLDITDRKRSEEALTRSEEKFRVIADFTYNWEYWLSPEGSIIYMSPSCERITGYSSAEFFRDPRLFSDIIHPDDLPAYNKHMDESSESANPLSVEYRIIRKDGEIRWISHACQPMVSASGELLGRRGSNRDETDRKLAELALRENEEKYRAFFTTSRDCVFITSIDGRWVDFNDAAVDMFGYDSREDLQHVSIPQLYANPAEREAHIRFIRERGYSFEYPVDLRKKDGTTINALITTVIRKDASGNIIGFQGSVRDITERKRTESLFLENQRQLATAMDLAHLANWEFDIATGIFTFNDRFYAMYGTTAEREGGYQMPAEVYAREFVHPDDASMVADEVRKAIETTDPGLMSQVEHRIIRRDGEIRYIVVRHAVIKDAGGRTIRTHGANQDITDRKRVEDALALEKQRIEALLSLSLMARKTDSETIAEVVEDAIRLTGSTIGYLATMNDDETVMTMQYWSKSAHESCKVIDKPIVYPVEKTGLWGEAVRQRKPIITNDYAADSPYKRGTPEGHVPLVRHMNIPVFDKDHIVAVAGVGNKDTDYDEGDVQQLRLLMQGWWQIAVRKRAEEALWDSREHYRALIDYSQLAIAVLDTNHRIIMVNPQFGKLFKKAVGDFAGKSCYCEFEKRDAVCTHCPGVRAMVSRKPEEVETEGVRDDGTRFYARNRAVPFFGPDGEVKGFVEMVEDITDRKLAELERERVRSWQGGVNRILAEVLVPSDLDEKLKIVTDGVVETFGADFCRIWLIDKGDLCDAGCMHAAATEGPHACRYRDLCLHLRASSGRYTHLDGRAHRRVPFGAYKIGLIASGEESKFLTNDAQHDPRVHNHAWAGELGLVGFAGYQLKPPSSGVLGVFALFTRFPISPDMDALLEVLSRAISMVIQKDISDQALLESERQTRESRQLFADIISFLPDPTFVIDKSGIVLAWNRAMEQVSGIPAEDIMGRGNYEYSIWLYGQRRPILIDLVLNPDKDAARLNYYNIRREGPTLMAETRATLQSGKQVTLSFVTSPLVDETGNVKGAIVSMRDISSIKKTEADLARLNANLEKIVKERTQALQDEIVQRKYAEQEVQAALAYTRSVIEANPDLMVVLDNEGRILDINTAGEVLTGIPKEQLIGMPYFGYLEDDGTLETAFSRLLAEGTIENNVRIRRADGHRTPLSVHAIVVRGDRGAPDRIIVSAHDITRQKADEEAIKASLDEKVLLLREVHHRVKNNLQIIISLTNLQMRKTEDPGVKQIMAETQNRVRAMSLVHEKLYRSTSLSQIDFADYTRFLATQLFSFYTTDTRRVSLEIQMSRMMVDINTAVPLGLIMNELVSNALKHAFPDNRKGTLTISGRDDGALITLVVRDDGVGIPDGFDWKNTASLGMRLMTGLVDQIDGTLTLERENGTAFILTVKRVPSTGGEER